MTDQILDRMCASLEGNPWEILDMVPYLKHLYEVAHFQEGFAGLRSSPKGREQARQALGRLMDAWRAGLERAGLDKGEALARLHEAWGKGLPREEAPCPVA